VKTLTQFHRNQDTIWVWDGENSQWVSLTIEERIERTIKAVIDEAMSRWQVAYGGFYPVGGQVGRGPLRPQHVGNPAGGGLRRWRFTTAGAVTAAAISAWIAAFAVGANDNAFIVVTGLHYPDVNPVVHEVQFVVGGKTNPIWNIEEIFSKLEPEFYFKKPLVCTPDTLFQTDVTASAGAIVQDIGLLGDVIGKHAFMLTF
jgi:hypothetical protein